MKIREKNNNEQSSSLNKLIKIFNFNIKTTDIELKIFLCIKTKMRYNCI